MPLTNSDAILWYNVGIFGEAGYAVPNWSNDVGSLNPQILDWTDLVGRNLFHIMHHEDSDLRIPPSINTLKRVHKLYLRAANILAGRAVPPGENNMEVQHARPAGEVFRVYPVPYFKVRNPFVRRWAGLVLVSLAEAMQHTENRKEMEISTAFAGQVGQYIKRVYVNMAIELFGKAREVAGADGFVLTDADFSAYNPGDFFTQTEMVDTVPRLDRVFTEDRLELLAEGIPVTQLPASLGPWPTNLTNLYEGTRSDATIGGMRIVFVERNVGTNHPRRSRPVILGNDIMFDWPAATVLLGSLVTLTVAIIKWSPRRAEPTNGRIYARAIDLAEIGARLTSLESAHHTLRAEIRADLKDLQDTIQQSLLRR